MPILAPLLLFILATFCVFALVGLVAVALTWHKIALFLSARRERHLLSMKQYHSRLSIVVSELMARANEIDQQSKYLPAETEKEWSAGYERIGGALVVMGDALVLIQERVEEKNVKSAREMILLLCREASLVSKRLLDFERRLLSAEKLQLEQIKLMQETIRQTEKELDMPGLLEIELIDTVDRSTTVDGGKGSAREGSQSKKSKQNSEREQTKKKADGLSD